MLRCMWEQESGFQAFPSNLYKPSFSVLGQKVIGAVPANYPQSVSYKCIPQFFTLFFGNLDDRVWKVRQLHSRTMSRGIKEFEKGFAEGVTCKDDCCEEEVHETPDGYLMPLEFLQAIATGHPNNVTYIYLSFCLLSSIFFFSFFFFL